MRQVSKRADSAGGRGPTDTDAGNGGPGLTGEVLAGKLLSATFSLIGLMVGFLAVAYAAVDDAGPWRADLESVRPFVWFMTVLVVAGCGLSAVAVLTLAGYISTHRLLAFGTCGLLGVISIFVILRAVTLAI